MGSHGRRLGPLEVISGKWDGRQSLSVTTLVQLERLLVALTTSVPSMQVRLTSGLPRRPAPFREGTTVNNEQWGHYDKAIGEVLDELHNAIDNYPAFNSAHEGMSVLREEVDELWDEVRVKQGKRDIAKMRHEAVQVAAMAIRFLMDIARTDSEEGQK